MAVAKSIHLGRSWPPRHAGDPSGGCRKGRQYGRQIMSFEQAAPSDWRAASSVPSTTKACAMAIQAALPATPMGELESIKALPA